MFSVLSPSIDSIDSVVERDSACNNCLHGSVCHHESVRLCVQLVEAAPWLVLSILVLSIDSCIYAAVTHPLIVRASWA